MADDVLLLMLHCMIGQSVFALSTASSSRGRKCKQTGLLDQYLLLSGAFTRHVYASSVGKSSAVTFKRRSSREQKTIRTLSGQLPAV